jgi:Uma2 family endonuclease
VSILSPAPESGPLDWTIADLQQRLDGIPAERIRTFPAPGTASEEDVLRVMARTGRICELVDGILVEKVMGSFESLLASTLIRIMGNFVEEHDLGVVLGEAGLLRLFPKLVRAPDVSFIRWERLPGDEFPEEAIWPVPPDLAVEIVSDGNTEAEMQGKVCEYFEAASSRLWIVDPKSRTTRIFTSPHCHTLVDEDTPLDAGNLLPGFELSFKEWVARARRRPLWKRR